MSRSSLLFVALAFVIVAGCSAPETPAAKAPDSGSTPKVGAMSGPANMEGKMKKNAEGQADKPAGEMAAVDFVKDVEPLLAKNCVGCHSGASPKGGLDLSAIKTKDDAVAVKAKMEKAASLVESRRMPPRNAAQPTPEERAKIVAGLRAL